MNQHPPLQVALADDAATRAAGAQWAEYLKAQALRSPTLAATVWHLCGELGAGKTTFTRGVLQGLAYQGRVKSPSYTLLELYTLPLTAHRRLTLAHFDLYRIPLAERAAQFYAAGFEEYLIADTLCVIEWPSPDLPCHARFDLSHHASGRDLQVTLNPSIHLSPPPYSS